MPMPKWNYRLIRHRDPELHYSIHAVYYDDHGNIRAWEGDPARLTSEDPAEMRDLLTLTRQALARPVLDASELPGSLEGSGTPLGDAAAEVDASA